MKLLLDTHVFLWFISGDERLPDAMCDSIRDPDNEVYLSVVSLWEAIVKHQLGKLPLPQPPESYLPVQREKHQISSLSLDEGSVSQLVNLPAIHRDPFDRMLVCQGP
jgi:PIN domain nuclease of toxin-antitoxin system